MEEHWELIFKTKARIREIDSQFPCQNDLEKYHRLLRERVKALSTLRLALKALERYVNKAMEAENKYLIQCGK